MTFPESYRMVYEEAQRALENQERRLMELRARAGTLVSVVTIATSFLGAQIFSRRVVPAEAWVGLGSFVSTVLMAILVLVPRHDKWIFESRPSTLLKWVEEASPPLESGSSTASWQCDSSRTSTATSVR